MTVHAGRSNGSERLEGPKLCVDQPEAHSLRERFAARTRGRRRLDVRRQVEVEGQEDQPRGTLAEHSRLAAELQPSRPTGQHGPSWTRTCEFFSALRFKY